MGKSVLNVKLENNFRVLRRDEICATYILHEIHDGRVQQVAIDVFGLIRDSVRFYEDLTDSLHRAKLPVFSR